MSAREMKIKAPAKLNLSLQVAGRRPDGYHLLESVMIKVNLYDDLVLTKGNPGIRLKVTGMDLPTGDDNLVVRAGNAFFEAAGLNWGVDVVLEKRIPAAAGLGGGSSDAAAMLTGLNEMAGKPLSAERLAEIGLTLGADVPFFLYPESTALASGIGEILRPGPVFENLWFMLINPGWPLSTAWVFKNLKLELTISCRENIFTALHESSFTIDRVLHNDLEMVVMPRYPELAQIKKKLMDVGAMGALMTGSGPTIFGVFDDRAVMENARKLMEAAAGSRWKVISTSGL